MAVALVSNRGNGSVDGTFSLTWTFTTSGAISSGNKAILAIVLHGSDNTIDSVSGGSVTWTQDSYGHNTDGEVVYFFSADAPSGISSGATITIVEHTGGDVFEKRRYSLSEWSGLATGAPGSTQKSGGSGTSTTPSSGATSASAGVGDLAIGAVAWKATSITSDWTVTSGYTKEVSLSANSRSMWVEYQILGSSGAVTSHPTTSLTTIQWAAGVVFYAAAITGFFGVAGLTGVGDLSAAGFITYTGSAALTGVGDMFASAGANTFDSAALTGVGDMTVLGFGSYFGGAALSGVGALGAAGVATEYDSVALTGVGALSARGFSYIITVVGTDISVSATGPMTVADLVAILNADPAVSALITASIPAGDGSDLAADLVTFHLAGGTDSEAFTPDATTYYETIYGTGSVIQTLPDDTPLDLGSASPGYVVKIVARDVDGPADPSTGVIAP